MGWRPRALFFLEPGNKGAARKRDMERFEQTLAKMIASAAGGDESDYLDLITAPPRPEMGDYSLPCFPLADKLKKDPKKIAQELAGKVSLEGAPFSAIEAAGPYINFRLDDAAMAERVLSSVFHEGERFGTLEHTGGAVVIDYSSPNIAKPFHIGHLRSTVIGAALYRLCKAAGKSPVGINHLGDWGTQFGMVMAAYAEKGDREELERRPIAYSLELYVEYNRKAEADPGARERAKDWFRRLEEGDPRAVELWERFRDLSLEKFKRIYKRLGVEFDHYTGESFYNHMMDEAVKKVEDAGILETGDDGARMVRLGDDGMPPFLLRKSDGATLYAAREIAAAIYRFERYSPELMLYVVGAPQELHFRQLVRVLEKMGHPAAGRVVHVKFGHVQGMSTRRGDVVMLEDVLDEAAGKARGKVEENVAAGKLDPGVDRDELSEAVGIGALIANDLKYRREKDISFDWDQVLNFDGETGPYLQYSYARIMGIMRKAGADPVLDAVNFALLDEPETRALVRKLADWPAVVEKAFAEYEPSLVTTYLFELTRAFNVFYNRHRVLGSGIEKEPARLLLAHCTGRVIKNGLEILGIPVLEKM